MEGHDILGKMRKVGAPPDFDERVFYRLREARRERTRRRAVLRYALAGSAAVFLAGYLLIGGGFPRIGGLTPFAGKEASVAEARRGIPAPSSLWGGEEAGRTFVPVLETLDYAAEYRNASPQPRTVYILEQVSDVRSSGIIY
jgi:hypothetical protein